MRKAVLLVDREQFDRLIHSVSAHEDGFFRDLFGEWLTGRLIERYGHGQGTIVVRTVPNVL